MQNANISEQNAQAGLLSIGAAAEYLGVSIDTLRRWEKKGKIIAFRSPGGHRYFEKEKLKNLFNQKYTRVPTTKVEKPSTEEQETPVPQILPVEEHTESVRPMVSAQEVQEVKQGEAEATLASEPTPTTQPPTIAQAEETQPIPKPERENREQELEKQKRREELLGEILKESPKKKKDSLQMAAIAGLVVFTIVDLVLLYLWFSTPKIISPLVP